MQKCPKCGRTYESDTQKFCTHDGGRLEPAQSASSHATTAYDLNQTIRTDQFDPEATVPRIPDLNKTVASLPTSEIRSKETGPATPPPAPQYQQPQANEQPPTVVFNQPPPPHQPTPAQQPYYQQPPAQQPPAQPAMQPPQQQQYAPAHFQRQQLAAQTPPATARKKSSRLPLIIGVVVILLAGGAAAWYFLIYKRGAATSANANSNTSADANANTNAKANANTSANTNANANTNAVPPPPAQPPNTTQFVNSKANLDGKLAEYYSDFSFYYPKSWKLDPTAGVAGAKNFVKIDRQESPDALQERFVVSYYESLGTLDADRATFPNLVETYSSNFAKSLPNYRKVSEGETKVGPYHAYEFRFESEVKNTAKGDVTYWGRVIFLPPGTEGAKNGITLQMLTSSLAPEIKSADDVGVKGELPVILDSFRMGKS